MQLHKEKNEFTNSLFELIFVASFASKQLAVDEQCPKIPPRLFLITRADLDRSYARRRSKVMEISNGSL